MASTPTTLPIAFRNDSNPCHEHTDGGEWMTEGKYADPDRWDTAVRTFLDGL